MKFKAKVKSGKQRGREIGFPTFNLVIPEDFSRSFGVYAAKVRLDGKEYLGALHFGPIPTYQEDETALEIFVIDYNSDQPIDSLQFELGRYIREIKWFSDIDSLKNQIAKDVDLIKNS